MSTFSKPKTKSLNAVVDESVHGYNEIATFQSSDRSLLLYRGFDYLHCRLLSHLQWEVNKLEEELDSLDQYELDQKDPERRLVSKREDGYYIRKEDFPNDFKCKFWRTRAEIWSELRVKLMEYGVLDLICYDKDDGFD